MANREQRSSREKRKPKAEKSKVPQASPFARVPSAGSPKPGAGKKGR
jgi:hypothetical protein